MELKGQKVLVVGGSSGIGLGVAKLSTAKGAHVRIAGRSMDKLKRASAEIGGNVPWYTFDATKESEVKAFFEKMEPFDHLVCAIHDARPSTLGRAMLPVDQIATDAAQAWMETKFWGQYFCAKHAAPKLTSRGSITLTGGCASRRWVPGHAAISATNAAVGAFGVFFAKEIGPKRVNVVAAGLVFTPAYDFLPKADKDSFFKNFGDNLPVKHVAEPEEMARTYVYLMESDYHTADLIVADGGWAVG